jgi:hypothetical protein
LVRPWPSPASAWRPTSANFSPKTAADPFYAFLIAQAFNILVTLAVAYVLFGVKVSCSLLRASWQVVSWMSHLYHAIRH